MEALTLEQAVNHDQAESIKQALIKQALVERRAELDSLTDGEFEMEYMMAFGDREDFIQGRENRTERLLLKLRHDMERGE